MTSAQLAPPEIRDTLAPSGRFDGLSRTFWAIFAGTIANRVGNMVVPFLVFYLGSRGASTRMTGAIVVAFGAGGFAGPALGGWLADRIGRRPALLIGLVATPVSLGVLYAAPDAPALGAAAVLLGTSGSLFLPAASALVVDSIAAPARPKAFSLLHWAVNIGTAVAAMSAGFLAVRGYGLLFLIDAATCLTFAAIVWFGTPRPPAPLVPAQRPAGSGYGVVLRDPLMVRLTLLIVAVTTVYCMTEYALPLAIHRDGLPPSAYGLVAAANAVLVVSLQPLLFARLARLRRVRVLAAAWTMTGAGIATTGLAHRPWQYALTTVLWSLGEVFDGVTSGGIVADLAPAHARGRYQGAAAWAWATGRLLAPALATAAFTTVGPGVLWWGCAVVGVTGAAAVARMAPSIERRTARR